MDNVIKFPDRFSKEKTKPATSEKMQENITEFRMGYIDDVSDFISNIMIMEMDRAGFHLEDTDMADIFFVRDSIKSLMMKKMGYAHPIQEIVRQSFDESDEDESEDLTNEEESAITEE